MSLSASLVISLLTASPVTEQFDMASNVRRELNRGIANIMIMTFGDRKNYRKPLLQRYVVRILLM